MKQKFLLKAMLLLCALVAGSSSVWASNNVSTVSTTFSATGDVTSKFTQTGDFTNAAWNLAVTWKSSASWQALNADKGSQIGSGAKPATGIVLTGSSIPGTITSVVVNTSGASSVNATVAVTVGGTAFKCNNNTTASLTSSAANYTFTGSASGDVVITWANSSDKAIYIKSITTTYSTGGGSDPSITLGSYSVNAPETAVSTTTINVTYNNLTNYDADVIFYESDGTTDAAYDHSWLTAEINATTKNLDYSITANTGAARTAYLRVYAVGDEGEAESSLITITQAAKSVAAPTFNPDGGTFWQGTEITLTSAGNTIYYTMTTNGSDPAKPTTSSTPYSAPIALGNSTTKIKAIAVDTYGNESSVASRTFTGVAPATLPFSWDAKETSTTGVISTSVGTYDASPYLKFDATNDNLILKFDETPGTLTFDIKGNSFSGGTFKVQTSADGETYSDLKVYTSLGDKTTETFILANTVRYIKWIYTNKSSGNVALGKINLTSTITLTPAKTYTTLTSAKDLDFTSVSSNLKAYIATEVNAGSVQMTQVNKVPAGTGLVLKATTPGSAVNVPVFDGTGADDVSANKMAGSATATTAIEANAGYILKDGVFQPASAGTLPAGKAYLNIAVSAGASALNLDFGETTGINSIENGKLKIESSEVYNLAGQRVANPTKGLYIVNGKKVIVK